MRLGRAWLLCVLVTAAACVSTPSPTVGPSPAPVRISPTTAFDYRQLEREVFSELNAARTDPSAYAAHLTELLPMFDGTLLRRTGSASAIRTTEGQSAVREAIDALRKQTRVPLLVLNDGLSKAARDLVTDQGRTGNTGHTASDGGSPEIRIDRYGRWDVTYSENIGYGTFMSGRDVVVQLIIDDGVPARGHRRNIFDANVGVAGVACGPHPRYATSCVIDQAGTLRPR